MPRDRDGRAPRMSLEGRAFRACIAYDRLLREMKRLTQQIGECRCPREQPQPDKHGLGRFPPPDTGPSCFQVQKKRLEGELERSHPDGPYRGQSVTLDMIAEAVGSCPSCTLLCQLIRERKVLKKELGAAKREMRSVARAASKTKETG